MRSGFVRVLRTLSLILLTSSGIASHALAQRPSARLGGRVTDVASGRPLQGVRVTVVGTQLAVGTNADGRYTILGVPTGVVEVRVQFIGFQSMKRPITLAAGQSATLDFALTAAATQLDAVITTATGNQRKLEVGNTVATIDAAALVAVNPVTNIGDLLVGKAAGVQVLGGNLTGSSQRIRIRGTNSVSLNNEPIFFIDGVRMTSDNNSSSIGIGGTNPSRLNDINPEDIESIEVVKGPAASTLYGTDAANGVIVIRTKRGKAGPARWSSWFESGSITDNNRWPAAYRGWRTGTTATTNSIATNSVQCLLPDRAAGVCTQDSVTNFNVFNDARTSPFLTGNRSQYGVSVSGGTDVARYFVSSEFENELGLLGVPSLAASQFTTRTGTALQSNQVRPNEYQRVNIRANLNFTPSSKSDVAFSSTYLQSDQRLPQTDNNATGLLSNATSGMGNFDTLRIGYRQFRPQDSFANITQQKVARYIGSMQANYRPVSWLSGRATVGVDYTGRNDYSLCKRNECGLGVTANVFNLGIGYATNNRSEFFQYTGDFGSTATFKFFSNFESRTAVGAQFVGRRFERNGANGENLPPGATLAGQGAIPSVNQLQNESRTLGLFADQTISWGDRVFLNAALRRDQNSAFGAEFGALLLPKYSLSYVVSEESWFPKGELLSSLRLRGARGEAATQPGVTDALQYFGTATVTDQAIDVPALIFSALGNNTLKPERVREYEVGVDATLANDRVTVEATGYDRQSRDGLLSRTLPPSTGGPATRLENIAEVRNRGFELLLNMRLIDKRRFAWDATVNGSRNINKLVSLGNIPPIIGTTNRQVPGYPLDGYWQRRITRVNDANNDGILVGSEVAVADTFSYVGPSVPINEVSLQNVIQLFEGKLRLSALVDRKSGHFLLNGTDRIRCETRLNCRGAVDPTASLEEQAAAVAVRVNAARTQDGFMQEADFWRLREVSAAFTIPDRFMKRVRGGSTATLVFTARNLKLWSAYKGIDPESNYFGGARGTVSDFQTQPPPTYYTIRFNLGL